MTATWTPFANATSLATLRANINTFNEALEVDVLNNEDDIISLGSTKISKSDTGIVFLVGGAIGAQSLTTSYAKVKLVDTTSVNVPNGHISVNNTTATYTFVTAGVYKLVFDGSCEAVSSAEFTFNYNINGVSHISAPPVFVGLGSGKPFSLGNHFLVSVTAGTVLYLEAKADSARTLTPVSCGFTIEKTHY